MNQIEYYESKLKYETDSWDLFHDLKRDMSEARKWLESYNSSLSRR